MKFLKYLKALLNDLISYRRGISVLMYHSIGDNSAFFTVRPEEFEWQMAYLKRKNFNVISLPFLVNCLSERKRILPNSVVITFDDGYEDNYENAFPVLKKYGFPFTVFLTTGLVGGLNVSSGVELAMLSWEQIKEMRQSGLANFEPHAVSHKNLAQVEAEEAENEIRESKSALEKALRQECGVFAYPKGAHNQTVKGLVRKYYRAAVGVRRGFVGFSPDLFDLPRQSVDSWVDRLRFRLKL